MSALFHTPGFLGTKASMGVDIALAITVVSILIFSLGAYFAKAKNFKAHKWAQTTGVVLVLLVTLWVMIPPFRDLLTSGLANHSPTPYYTSIVHGIVGVMATLFGIYVALRGHKLTPKALSFKKNYRLYMRMAYWLYVVAALLGTAAYIAWYM